MRDTTRKYTLQDLIDECSKIEPVSKRSIQLDLERMRSKMLGHSAPIVVKERKYYTYSDPKYTILNTPLLKDEVTAVENAINTLTIFSKFKQLKDIKAPLTTLHEKIANDLGINPPKQEQDNEKVETIRCWINYTMVDKILRTPLAINQKVEFAEIDGSINIVFERVVDDDFIQYLLDNHTDIKVTYPTSLQKKIKKLYDEK